MNLLEFKASPNCLRVRMALRLKGVKVTSVEIDPLDRREVERVSGQKLVPVLVDGRKVLHDSTTILRYLDRKFPDPPLFPAAGPASAKTEILVDWTNQVFRLSVHGMFQQAFRKKEERESTKIRELSKRFQGHLRLLEAWLSDGRTYLTGESLTAADLCLFPFVTYAVLPEKLKGHVLYGLHYKHFALPENLTALTAWLQTLQPLSDWETRLVAQS